MPEYTFNEGNTNIASIAIAPTQYEDELLLRFRQDQVESIDIVTPLPVARLFTFVAKENREARFAKTFSNADGTHAQSLQNRLGQIVSDAGYDVVEVSAPDEESVSRDSHGLLKKIPRDLFGNADSLLETSGEIGFTAAGRGKPFKPTLWFTVRLTDKDGVVLMYDRILLNPPDGGEEGLVVYPSDTHVFENIDELEQSEQLAVALEYAIDRVSNEFAYLLQGPVTDVQ